MTAAINGRAISEGSIISGTLRAADLIAAFSEEIRRLSVVHPRIVFESEIWLQGPVAYSNTCPEKVSDQLSYEEAGSVIVRDLLLHLNYLVPDGYSFGPTDVDPSDFGWWKVEIINQ